MQAFLIENSVRISALQQKFAGHAINIDQTAMAVWLLHFDEADWDLGLRFLDSVEYYSQPRILDGCGVLHQQAMQLASAEGHSRVYVASFGSAGKSGEVILYNHKLRNNLSNSELIRLTDLESLASDPTVGFIFVDDIVGSGEQAINTWQNIAWALNPKQNTVLAVHVAFQEGIDRIQSETRLQVVCLRYLLESDKVFSPQNVCFTNPEKETLLRYCYAAGDSPKGYKELQANVVFYYRAPDNAISILRSTNPNWKGLFARVL